MKQLRRDGFWSSGFRNEHRDTATSVRIPAIQRSSCPIQAESGADPPQQVCDHGRLPLAFGHHFEVRNLDLVLKAQYLVNGKVESIEENSVAGLYVEIGRSLCSGKHREVLPAFSAKLLKRIIRIGVSYVPHRKSVAGIKVLNVNCPPRHLKTASELYVADGHIAFVHDLPADKEKIAFLGGYPLGLGVSHDQLSGNIVALPEPPLGEESGFKAPKTECENNRY